MRSKRHEPAGRDQDTTPFTEILQRLLDLDHCADAAVLVDSQGEAVDYAGTLPVFYTKISGAYLRIILDELMQRLPKNVGVPQDLIIRGSRRSFLVRRLPDGYALIVVLRRQAFRVSPRALAISERALSREAGWPAPRQVGPAWYPVEVATGLANRRRPLRMRIGSEWQGIEVLGSVVGLGRDRGYRCRLRSGAELTLVREPAGTWYTDEQIDDAE